MRQPIETAPKDGTVIVGIYEDREEDHVVWLESRQCMLSSVARGAGECGKGWASALCDFLPVDPPVYWRPLEAQP